MDNAAVITQDSKTRSASKLKSAALCLLWGGLLIFRGIAGLKIYSSHPSQHVTVALYPLIGLGLLFCLLGFFVLFGLSSFGSVGYQEIADPRVEQRVRERYASEIDQLTFLGFNYAFTSGESMSLSRMLLIYPAVVWLRMRANGAVVTLGGGRKILSATPVLNSPDGRVFARCATLGMAFCTEFRDKTILITKNYKGICGETPECVILCSSGTIAETWQLHKERLNKMDTEANPALRDRSYPAYADIARREDLFIKSQR